MTSIYDQYLKEDLLSSSSPQRNNYISQAMEQYGYLDVCDSAKEKENGTSLDLNRLNVLFPAAYRMQFMSVGANIIACTTTNNMLYYFSWESSDKPKEIEVNKVVGNGYKIKNLFCDPIWGCHVLLAVSGPSSTVNSYNSTYTNVNNVNNSALSVVGSFDSGSNLINYMTSGNATGSSQNTSNSTYELLYMNTCNGAGKLKHINKLRNHEITAVGWNKILVNSQCTSFIVLGTSKGVIFEIEINVENEKFFQNGVETYCKQLFDVGKGNNASSAAITGLEFHQFENTSDCYFVLVMTSERLYQFVGKTSGNDEKLFLSQIFNNYLNIPEGFIKIPSTDNSFSTLRLYYKEDKLPSSFACHIVGEGIVYGKLNLEWNENTDGVCLANPIIDYQQSSSVPISLALTEFHLLLLYPNKIEAISVLNKEVVFVHKNDDIHGKYVDICADLAGNIWVLSEKTVLKGKFIGESSSVWEIYKDMNEFSLAKKYCGDDSNKQRMVMIKEAEYCFNEGLYKKSACLYSQIDGLSFEEVSLKFLDVSQTDALKTYLFRILENLKPQESTHITVITLWLLEIFEREFAEMKNGSESNGFDNGSLEFQKLYREFEVFLSSPYVSNCISTNKEVVYKILNSYGDFFNLVKLASFNKEYENLVKYYLEEGRVDLALKLFENQMISSVQKNLIKNFVSEFMSMAPKETVDLLIKLGRSMDPLSLISSLVIITENSEQALETIRYLEYCVHSLHSRDESIHNYLITLYAKYKPDKLMQYLATQGSDSLAVNYDVRYALKICQEYGLREACVQLSALLGLWECSVDLALSVDLDLAKQMAVQPSHQNSELCKRLWLKIAQHVVHQCNDIEKAMNFLQQCDLIKIEDVLPFFSDFVTIDLFKDAICKSLQGYNERIELLKEEIEDAINSADLIRSDIQSFKDKYAVIQSSDVCCSCNIQLLLRPFHIFPCSHYFHTDCLKSEMEPYLEECDVADECFYCGRITIGNIDKPFVKAEEFDKIRLDWE